MSFCIYIRGWGEGGERERERGCCRYIEAVNYGNLTECRDCSAWG